LSNLDAGKIRIKRNDKGKKQKKIHLIRIRILRKWEEYEKVD
jgi:hypothetical protein